jgi:RimJ/RimL family protein N-acetyltransferase
LINPSWCLTTARLDLRPCNWADLPDLTRLKADPRAFALMLGGVRNAAQTGRELAEDIGFWGARGYGVWVVRERVGGGFIGMTGLAERADGRGIALRFAMWPEARGVGLAREAASAALFYGHDRAKLARIVAVAREDNFGSRSVLGAIGMIECQRFPRDGAVMLVYESVRPPLKQPDLA